MKVILLEKVPNVGDLGTVAKVRAGYARNYLLPRGKAERATPQAAAEFEHRRADLEKRQQEQQQILRQGRDSLDGYLLQMPARASPDGSLYGSITAAGIAAALNAQKIIGMDIRRGQVSLPAGNLKTVGDHKVNIVIESGVEAAITVAVLAGDAETSEATQKGGR